MAEVLSKNPFALVITETQRERVNLYRSGFNSLNSSHKNLPDVQYRLPSIQLNSNEKNSKILTRNNSFVSSILSSGTLHGAQIRIPYVTPTFMKKKPDQPIISNP